MTQLVYPFTLVPGTPENVNQLNDNLGAIQSVVNGNIGSDNIADGGVDFAELSPQIQNGYADNLQAGVVGATDGKVTYASASGVSVAAGSGWVANASGLLRRITWAGNAVTVPVSTGTRLDQIVIDSTGTLARVAGTEQGAGVATLDNRTGAGALPTGTLRLADLLITTAGVVNATANIRDRRPWARGAHVVQDDYLPNLVADATTRLTVDLALDMGRKARIECSGALLRLSLDFRFSTANLNEYLLIWCLQDGQPIDPGARRGEYQNWSHGTSHPALRHTEFIVHPTPGSHFYEFRLSYNGSAQATIHRAAPIDNTNPIAGPLIMEIEEDLRPNASNGAA